MLYAGCSTNRSTCTKALGKGQRHTVSSEVDSNRGTNFTASEFGESYALAPKCTQLELCVKSQDCNTCWEASQGGGRMGI